MDTNVLPLELEKACEKLDARDERAAKNAGHGATTAGKALSQTYIDKLIPVVAERILSVRSDERVFPLMRILRLLDPAVVAFVCLRGGLTSVGANDPLRSTCMGLGKMLSTECWAADLTQSNQKLAHRISKAVKAKHGNLKYRRTAAEHMARKAGYTVQHWTRTEMLDAGKWCVEVLVNGLPEIFELVDRETRLGITDKGIALAEAAVAEAVNRSPVYQPRTELVAPWVAFTTPLLEGVVETKLLRTRYNDTISAAKHAIKTGQMQPALDAVNALQSVPFRINTWIMDVINAVYEADIRVEGLPMLNGLPEMPSITDEAFKALTPAEREVRLKEASGLKQFNRQNKGDKVAFREDMETAKRLAAYDSFVTPMNMDWRGRVYGIPHFNFQREDRVRAMFLFANGAPIGERGIYWLKVHVANCAAYDKIDKKPIEERVQWVDANLETITAVVADPLGTNATFAGASWRDADSPFLFLAAARELISAISVGTTYVCSLPLAFDGSCSGLQHLAAMTRAVEGEYVNLTNNEIPADVYQLVADIAHKSIEADTEYPELRKQCLDFGVTRSLVKRNTMTFAYSSKVYGMSLQHMEDTMEPLRLKVLKKELEVHPFGDDEGYAASKYLAKHIHAAIVKLVELPAEAMGFMQTLARVLAHEGKPLRWVTPAGIPWINRYHEPETKVVKLWLDDHGVKVRASVTLATGEKKEIAKDKAASGVSPNFVHACDASHLLLTVNASVAEGIGDIATVHDSFGCLPCHADRFNAIIREQFRDMYTKHDVLAELLASAKADLTEASHHKLPELPAKGDLDLEEVLSATYAFA